MDLLDYMSNNIGWSSGLNSTIRPFQNVEMVTNGKLCSISQVVIADPQMSFCIVTI